VRDTVQALPAHPGVPPPSRLPPPAFAAGSADALVQTYDTFCKLPRPLLLAFAHPRCGWVGPNGGGCSTTAIGAVRWWRCVQSRHQRTSRLPGRQDRKGSAPCAALADTHELADILPDSTDCSSLCNAKGLAPLTAGMPSAYVCSESDNSSPAKIGESTSPSGICRLAFARGCLPCH